MRTHKWERNKGDTPQILRPSLNAEKFPICNEKEIEQELTWEGKKKKGNLVEEEALHKKLQKVRSFRDYEKLF